MVGLVAQPGVAWRPGFDAVGVGVGTVVLFKDVAGADPVVEDADEDAVPAVSAVIADEMIVVRAAFDQHARRVAGVHLAGILAQAVAEVVVPDSIAASRPELEAGV